MNSRLSLKGFASRVCPPILWDGLRSVKTALTRAKAAPVPPADATSLGRMPTGQALDIYWSPRMGDVLDTWGAGNAWHEIQLLLATCEGKVLDIACGTGGALSALARFPQLEVHGCDISDLLLDRALAKGIPQDRLTIMDATRMSYTDKSFDYAYSIGSLEHFTEKGIAQFLEEANRVTRRASFHLVPVAKSGLDEGWLEHDQSFFNNSVAWWLAKYRSTFPGVRVLHSIWESEFSAGMWFVCTHTD